MKLEQQLLPHADLAPLYDKAVWVYVYQTFDGTPEDMRAEHIAMRFGVTSWPQLVLADPVALKALRHVGRSAAAFQTAFAAVELPTRTQQQKTVAASALMAADRRAVELFALKDGKATAAIDLATQTLFGDAKARSHDIVVRTRAAQILAARKPALLVEHAAVLLKTPSDPFRYLICQALGKAGATAAAPHLEALVRDPQPSLNPNVVRIRAVQALATCGRVESIAVVAPYATSGVYFNGLTGVAIDTLARLAARLPETQARVAQLLRAGYPVPPSEPRESKMGMRKHRAATALARRIHKATGDPRSFPASYDEAARTRLMQTPEELK
ncbi:MAG: HEAT repeat domain-containing protein [Planctomycetota bacterium]|nr:HEAT repeat domain-containing protein [Planctomycetota bacterium]